MSREQILEFLEAARKSAVEGDPGAVRYQLQALARHGNVPGGDEIPYRFAMAIRNVLRDVKLSPDHPSVVKATITKEDAIVATLSTAFVPADDEWCDWPMPGGQALSVTLLQTAINLIRE